MTNKKNVSKKKPVAKKNVSKKKPVAKKKVVKKLPKIISYGIKMVIPTVAYGNIQPEVIVKANSLEKAHDFIVPHMNKLWKEYYLVDGKRPEVSAPIITKKEETPPVQSEVETQSPVSSVALVKATKAIESCMGLEALDIIVQRVNDSTKLTPEDKETLQPLLTKRNEELNEKK